MTLSNALEIGRSGLLASQTALQVTGNNLANMATRGYRRQSIDLAAAESRQIQSGIFLGRGVQIQSITRQIDEALEARLRGSIADESRSETFSGLLGQVEAIENEFSGVDLSTRLNAYFNAWSQLAGNPQDLSLRTLLVQEAATLTEFINGLDSELKSLQLQVDRTTAQTVSTANGILDRIEDLNQRIAFSDHGVGGAAGMRDQRDALLSELSHLLDVSIIEQESGVIDIFSGSLPIMLNGQSRGIEVRSQAINGQMQTEVVVAADGSLLDITSGQISALAGFRHGDLEEAITTLDNFAGQLIFQTNRLHSQGQGLSGLRNVLSMAHVNDVAMAINDPEVGLDFVPTHGSFELHLTQRSTGQRATSVIFVDLDGLGGNDTTLTSLVADINAVANVSAAMTPDGRLQLAASGSDYEISFSSDSSGILAAMGVGSFFTGSDAFNIGVNRSLAAAPGVIAAALDHFPGDNQTALAMVQLRKMPLDQLGGVSLSQCWNRHVEDFAIRLARVRQQQQADSVVRQNLEIQQQSISGVNADEEAIDLITYQRAYQASARFLSVIEELMDTLLGLV